MIDTELARLSPTQRRIFSILSDGKAHPKKELIDCLTNGSKASSIHYHLNKIRARIRPYDRDVVACFLNQRICYRYVGIIRPSNSVGDSPR